MVNFKKMKGYSYYNRVKDFYNDMQRYIDDSDESFDEDFSNLRLLASEIMHLQQNRVAHTS
ncbi:hypothetical protein AV649_16470 [Rossellomorea marisflavi]|uniref:Uncharacterized protein n=1 Tax=Rossellomorea marisflavi TaxID=189381 RepID=A0A165L488_9BACI|nr:hypothetical protein AV649_16470 [Rossellomorea marisflavi]